ncbi:putative DD41D transposase [Trichonephila clavipes]|nr:putative DD41D transposase [Trichonephila clavipes]
MSIGHSDELGEIQQDNATPHMSRISTEWLQYHSSEFRNFRWPPKSPDMRNTEYIWDALQHAVQKRSPHRLIPTDLCGREKQKVIESVEEGERKVDVAKTFEIPLSLLSTILKNKEKIFSASSSRVRKSVRKGFPSPNLVDVDDTLAEFNAEPFLWEALPKQDLTFDDYVLVDTDVAVWGVLSDAEIGALNYNNTESDEDESEELTLRFIEWAQNEIAVVPDFHKRILFSDETHFWLNGYVNKQNCRIWSEANSQVYVETPLHPEKLTVWGALWAGGIIGPYFFKNDEGHNVTVNGDRYRAMITNLVIPELNNHDVQELWFQQDGATCHTARATIDLLKDTFGDRLISRLGPVNWPPRSCDLTPLEYFL